MKDYADYMNNITPDPSLKGKILKLAKSKTPARSNKRSILSYAGLVATAAVLLLGIWVLPDAIYNMRGPDGSTIHLADTGSGSNDYDAHTIRQPVNSSPENNENSATTGDITEYEADVSRLEDDPNAKMSLYDPDWYAQYTNRNLDDFIPYFTEGGEMILVRLWGDQMIFWRTLTPEQLHSIIPGLDSGFSASATYTSDGTLIDVQVSISPERSSTFTGDSSEFSMPYLSPSHIPVRITIAEGSLIFCPVSRTYPFNQTFYVHGVSVTAHFSGITSSATFMLDNIVYGVTTFCEMSESQSKLEELLITIIQSGPADLSVLADPVIPNLRNDHITLDEARQDPTFGEFAPASIPYYMPLEIANRWLCQFSNYLLLAWGHGGTGTPHLRWMIREAESHHHNNIMTPQQFESLENILRFPIYDGERTARRAFAIPVFLIEDLTIEMLEAIAFWVDAHQPENESEDPVGWWVLSLAILYGEIAIEISSSMLSPQQVWDMLPR